MHPCTHRLDAAANYRDVVLSMSEPSSPAAELPKRVRRYLEGTLPSGGSVPARVRLTLTGEMRQKPDGCALRFSAIE
jgi:hypothetical protein